MCTLPSTLKGTAKVRPGCGVKINYIYYWSEAFRDPGIECQQVPVQYEPFDVGTAYAFVGHQWVQCHSEHYAAFQGRSEREVMLASKELLRRHQHHSSHLRIAARKLADLLQSLEADEVLLAQRMRDLESRAVRSGLGLTATNLEGRSQGQKDSVGLPPEKDAPEAYETYGEF